MTDVTAADVPMSPIETLFALKPDAGADPVGAALHATWLAMVENGVPFETNDSVVDENPDFADWYGADFFPHRAADPSASLVGGLPDDWWTAYSTALVCDALSNMVMTVRPMLNAAAIAADLAVMSPQLTATAHAEYLGQFHIMFNSVIAPALATPDALMAYTNLLTSPAWIAARQAAIVSGQWPDADWELFNHTLKLRVLGASDVDVSTALAQLTNGGLTVPSDVNAATWVNYQPYLHNPPLQWSDLSTDGQDGLHAPSYFWRDLPLGTESSSTPDGLALEFVKLVKYYVAPSGSCFTPTTRVLLADGSDMALGDVHPGDRVWTPDGPRQVRVVATVDRRGRTLTRINGARFACSDSHPFVDGAATTASLAVNPARAAAFTPGIDATGVGALAAGVSVMVVAHDGTIATADVECVDEVAVADDAERMLIDLILEAEASGFPAYAVGDGGNTPFYLVRSEVLRYERHPLGMIAGLALLVGSLDASMAAMAPLSRADSTDVAVAMRHVASPLVADALRRLAELDQPFDDQGTAGTAEAHEELDAMLGAFHAAPGAAFDWRLGALHEALAATLLIPLDHVVRAAIRAGTHALDSVHTSGATILTIHDVVGEGHFPFDGGWTVTAAINGVGVGTRVVGDPDGAAHHRRIDWTLPPTTATDGDSTEPAALEVTLSTSDGARVLAGRGVLRPAAVGGYHHTSIPLRASLVGPVDALVRVDAVVGGSGWAVGPATTLTDEQQRALARRFGRALATSFTELFPVALAAVRRRGRPDAARW